MKEGEWEKRKRERERKRLSQYAIVHIKRDWSYLKIYIMQNIFEICSSLNMYAVQERNPLSWKRPRTTTRLSPQLQSYGGRPRSRNQHTLSSSDFRTPAIHAVNQSYSIPPTVLLLETHSMLGRDKFLWHNMKYQWENPLTNLPSQIRGWGVLKHQRDSS